MMPSEWVKSGPLGVTIIYDSYVTDECIAAMISDGGGIRQAEAQRIMAFNLGIALDDVATAAEIYRLVLEKSIGISLSA